MSYGMGDALQAAVFAALQGDGALGALVGSAIYDAPPQGVQAGLYVTLGPEDVRARSDKTGAGARHDFTVSVVTDGAGFIAAKATAAAVSDVLDGANLALARGRLVAMNFLRARARLVSRGAQRQIELRFRALVEDG